MNAAMPPPNPPANAAQNYRIRRERTRFGPWTLEVEHDGFLGRVRCRLSASHMLYEHGALVFQMGRRTDTYDAIYRIDQRPPASWRVNAMELAVNGLTFDEGPIEHPSGGQVAIPLRLLTGARTVSLRASSSASVRTFQLTGLDAASDAAAKAGCDDRPSIGPPAP